MIYRHIVAIPIVIIICVCYERCSNLQSILQLSSANADPDFEGNIVKGEPKVEVAAAAKGAVVEGREERRGKGEAKNMWKAKKIRKEPLFQRASQTK